MQEEYKNLPNYGEVLTIQVPTEPAKLSTLIAAAFAGETRKGPSRVLIQVDLLKGAARTIQWLGPNGDTTVDHEATEVTRLPGIGADAWHRVSASEVTALKVKVHYGI